MINLKCLKSDLKQILRDPILVVFVFMPLFMYVIFKLVVVYFRPYLYNATGFDLSSYNNYILAISFIMTPNMLGAVFGFLMLDERDGHITELMIVTPIGYSGYILNRLFLPMLGCLIYTFVGYFILNIYPVPFIKLLILVLLLGIESLLFGLTLFNLADDKVKGVTYAKAFSWVTLFALADLMNKDWVSLIASFIPFYWISKVINSPLGQEGTLYNIFMAIIVHMVWLLIYLKLTKTQSILSH